VSHLKKVVIGLLCLALVVALGFSVASTLQQISLFDVTPYAGDPGGGSRPGDIILFDVTQYAGDPGGGSRPG